MLSLSTGVTVFADKNTNNIEASGISPYMDYFDLDDREMETYMYKLCECAPFFYFGYSDQLYNVYLNDRARMIENVEKARARYFQDHHLN